MHLQLSEAVYTASGPAFRAPTMAGGDNNPKCELSSQWDMRRGFPVAIHTTQ